MRRSKPHGKRAVDMIYLTKRGLLIIDDGKGNLFYFDPADTLKDVASYIGSNESLSDIIREPDRGSVAGKNVVYVDTHDASANMIKSFPIMKDDLASDNRLRGLPPAREDRRFRDEG